MAQPEPSAPRATWVEPAAVPPQQPPTPLSAQETHPGIKRLASDIALAITTYEIHEGVADIAARLPLAGDAAMALAATFHYPGTWSRGRIVYPQLGGILPDRASVMVVTEQLIGAPEGLFMEVRTLDVRLRQVAGQWQFDHLASIGGERQPAPAILPIEALAVLENPRIELPDSARWDIHAGRISLNLLRLMARMAEHAPYGVVSLSSGHPWEVFGTDRQSDHTRGLAVDVYRVGDTLVIDDRAEGSPTHALAAWLHAQPETARIGSPWRFSGDGAISFTDALHQDHLHIAVHPDVPG